MVPQVVLVVCESRQAVIDPPSLLCEGKSKNASSQKPSNQQQCRSRGSRVPKASWSGVLNASNLILRELELNEVLEDCITHCLSLPNDRESFDSSLADVGCNQAYQALSRLQFQDAQTWEHAAVALVNLHAARMLCGDLGSEAPDEVKNLLNADPSIRAEINLPLVTHRVDQLKLSREIFIALVDNVTRVSVEEELSFQQ